MGNKDPFKLRARLWDVFKFYKNLGGGVEFASVHILLGRVGPECSAGEVLQFLQVGLFNSGPSVTVLGWLIPTCKDQLVNFQRLCELVVKHRHSILNDVNL